MEIFIYIPTYQHPVHASSHAASNKTVKNNLICFLLLHNWEKLFISSPLLPNSFLSTFCVGFMFILSGFFSSQGEYHWREGGEKHINDPRCIANLQVSLMRKYYYCQPLLQTAACIIPYILLCLVFSHIATISSTLDIKLCIVLFSIPPPLPSPVFTFLFCRWHCKMFLLLLQFL